MNILVTGAHGFVGKNLCAALKNIADGKDKSHNIDSNISVFEFDLDVDPNLLNEYCKNCDFVFHLAGVNRPQNEEEFIQGNFGFTSILLETLKKHNNTCPVMISSSIQASLDNPYGKSKKRGKNCFANILCKREQRCLYIAFLTCLESGADLIITRQLQRFAII